MDLLGLDIWIRWRQRKSVVMLMMRRLMGSSAMRLGHPGRSGRFGWVVVLCLPVKLVQPELSSTLTVTLRVCPRGGLRPLPVVG